MQNLVCLFVFSLITAFSFSPSRAPDSPKNIRSTNGSWFDGHSFRRRNAFAVDGVLAFRRPSQLSAVLDLGGGFAIPPFGEVHNDKVEPLNKMDRLIQRYLQHGIFYFKDPDNLPMGRDQVLPKINRPESIDVVFSNGGFTGEGGHPAEGLKRNIDRGVRTEAFAAHHGISMVTTLGDAAQIDPGGADNQQRKERDDLHRRNLTLLNKHRVRLALGSDHYRSDPVPEAPQH